MKSLLQLEPPTEQEFKTTTKTVVVSIVLTAALVIFANFISIEICNRSSSNLGYYLLRDKWNRLETSSPIDTIVLGDSSGNQGVVPSLLEDSLGGSSMNLCTTAGSLVITDVWMLNRYIEKHGAPKRVVVVHAYDGWLRNREGHLVNVLSQTPQPKEFWSKSNPRVELSTSESSQLMAAKWFPIYNQNVTLQMFVFNPVGAFRPPPITDKGFMQVNSANQSRTLREHNKFTKACTNSNFSFSEINEKSVNELVALAEKHRFKIYFVTSPIYDQTLANENAKEFCEAAHLWIKQKIRNSNQCHLLFKTPVPFPIEQLESLDHVNVEGANVFTQMIADRVIELESR